jgi:hypothetical protein
LDDLAVGLPAWRRCGMRNHLLGLSGLPISGTRGVVHRRRIWLSRALGSPKAGSSLAMATSSAIRARHPSRPSVVG